MTIAEVHVATAGCDKKVAIWNVVTQRCVATRDSGAAVVCDLAWQVLPLSCRPQHGNGLCQLPHGPASCVRHRDQAVHPVPTGLSTAAAGQPD